MKLYSLEMTRFMIDIDEAINLIEYGLKVTGFNVIPNIKSFRVKDLFDIYQEKFKLKYTIGLPRISEKLHEMMVSNEEVPRTIYNEDDDVYYMHYKNTSDSKFIWDEYTSDKTLVTKQELDIILQKYNYFKQ